MTLSSIINYWVVGFQCSKCFWNPFIKLVGKLVWIVMSTHLCGIPKTLLEYLWQLSTQVLSWLEYQQGGACDVSNFKKNHRHLWVITQVNSPLVSFVAHRFELVKFQISNICFDFLNCACNNNKYSKLDNSKLMSYHGDWSDNCHNKMISHKATTNYWS